MKVPISAFLNKLSFKKLEVVQKVTIPISSFLLKETILSPPCRAPGKFRTPTLKIWLDVQTRGQRTRPISRSLSPNKTRNSKGRRFNEIPRVTRFQSKNRKLSLRHKMLTSRNLTNQRSIRRRSMLTTLMTIKIMSLRREMHWRITKIWRPKFSKLPKIKTLRASGSRSIKKSLEDYSALRKRIK